METKENNGNVQVMQNGMDNAVESYNPHMELPHYKFPTLDLLKDYDNKSVVIDNEQQEFIKQRIKEVFLDFRIEIDSISVSVGPTFSLYVISLARGVRMSTVNSLKNEIDFNLAISDIYIKRIIVPLPGTVTIGIEIPNVKPSIVSMKTVLSSREYVESQMELPVSIGHTVSNNVYMFDLTKLPHLLIAGGLGQGKSSVLNTIITSFIYKKHPSELKLVLIDFQMTEFGIIYSKLNNHFLAKMPGIDDAIVSDPISIINTLKSLCIEVDNRYKFLKDAHVRSIVEYNNLIKEHKLSPEQGHHYQPYIVVVIDEYSNLMKNNGMDFETPLVYIAQRSRVVGVHLIISTWVSNTDTITSIIKANFPARMAFRVKREVESRNILDMPGANSLIGKGDVLFSWGFDTVRLQCAYVDNSEIETICQYIGEQDGFKEPFLLPNIGEDLTQQNI